MFFIFQKETIFTFFLFPFRRWLLFCTFSSTADVIILVTSSLQPSCATFKKTHDKCRRSSSVFQSSVTFENLLSHPPPSLVFPSASQQHCKIFISILIVFFHYLSFDVNTVMSDYSESCTNPLRLFTELTGMLARLCLEAHRARYELLILAMSLGTLHSLPVTDSYLYKEWKQHGTD